MFFEQIKSRTVSRTRKLPSVLSLDKKQDEQKQGAHANRNQNTQEGTFYEIYSVFSIKSFGHPNSSTKRSRSNSGYKVLYVVGYLKRCLQYSTYSNFITKVIHFPFCLPNSMLHNCIYIAWSAFPKMPMKVSGLGPSEILFLLLLISHGTPIKFSQTSVSS